MWFFPKKKLKIHVFCDHRYLIKHKSIKKSAAFVPNWWKNLKPTYKPDNERPLFSMPTMKSCSGFTNLYKYGFMIPLWCDVKVMIGKIGTTDYYFQYADQISSAVEHDERQRTGFVEDTEYQHLKFNSPWLIYCEEDIDFIALQPTWNLMKCKNISVLPGAYSFKTIQSTNINLMFTRTNEDQIIDLQAGSPIIHFIPLTQRKIELVYHFENKKLSLRTDQLYREKFTRSYEELRKHAPEDVVCPMTGKIKK